MSNGDSPAQKPSHDAVSTPPIDHTPEAELRRRTRRSFLGFVAAAGGAYAGWRWLKNSPQVDGIPGPLRNMLGFNEEITRRLFDPQRLVQQPPESALTLGGPRANGDIGLDSAVDLSTWRLRVEGTELAISMSQLKTLPEISQITPLRCIEGWTTVARWTGVRFSDFVDTFHPAGRTQPYVSLATADKEYYVGLDADSAYHPQTILCYKINNEPLSNEHGAPLRLLIPTKYGIKNIKRIGLIGFGHERPADYWAEQGYDWYAGL